MSHSKIQAQYEAFKQLGLKLDMSRGKPAPEQLDLSNALLGSRITRLDKPFEAS